MKELEVIIDFGAKNLRLGVFDSGSKNIYASNQRIIKSEENTGIEKSLNILIKDAEKYLSSHIDNVVVLYDSPKFYSLDISIKKVFDNAISIKQVYSSLIEEAHYFITQNNFKDQIIHSIINNIVVDENKKLDKITQDFKIKSLILEIKFICLSKIIINDLSNKFKKNNLKILNLYCSSYVKTIYYKKKINNNHVIFFDIGFERSTSLIFNDDKFDYFKSISLGGNNITKDISKVLDLGFEYSENLKVKFYMEENYVSKKTNHENKINPYSEILEKNLSIDLLKQIIQARVDEIVQLTLEQNNYNKNFYLSERPIIVFIGAGSKLVSNAFNQSANQVFLQSTYFDENDRKICEAGLHYNKSEESSQSKYKKRSKQQGFFERFFNLFSK